jgi:hypothetical protein
MRRRLLATTLASACGTEATDAPRCARPEHVTLTTLPSVIDEASGIAIGGPASEVLWLHNDGDDGRLFAVNRTGILLATVVLPPGSVVDAEDLALEVFDDGREVAWLADIGDNDLSRPEVAIVRVPLPALGQAPGTVIAGEPQRFRLRYPDRPRNAEALVLDPSGDLFVIVKAQRDASETEVFRARQPLSTQEVRTLEPAFTIVAQGPVTGAALHDDVLAVRTTLSALVGPWSPAFDGTTACAVTLPDAATESGEAIAWRPDGRGLVVTHEGVGAVVSELIVADDAFGEWPPP